MVARLRILWAAIRDSLWFIPALLTVASSGLAITLVELERAGRLNGERTGGWLLSGGAEGAQAVLSSIATSLVTVTGVIFSVTIVALQLASSQFTPRILRNFTADRSNQIVLGVFISTFAYTLLVLRVIRSPGSEKEEFVPLVAVSVAIFLMLVSIGFLIYFIHHAAESIQVAVILDRVATESLHQVKRLFPHHLGMPEEGPLEETDIPSGKPKAIGAANGGYLQGVDGDTLFRLGEKKQLVLKMAEPVGAFLIEDQTIAWIWSCGELDAKVMDQIRTAFVIGRQRTPEQDVEFGLIEISDIAVKALSPGINDPTTAVHCIDRLAEILVALGQRRPPADLRTAGGKVHFIAMHTTLDRGLLIAFDQILHFGMSNPLILTKLRSSLGVMEALIPEQRRNALRQLKAELAKADGGNR